MPTEPHPTARARQPLVPARSPVPASSDPPKAVRCGANTPEVRSQAEAQFQDLLDQRPGSKLHENCLRRAGAVRATFVRPDLAYASTQVPRGSGNTLRAVARAIQILLQS